MPSPSRVRRQGIRDPRAPFRVPQVTETVFPGGRSGLPSGRPRAPKATRSPSRGIAKLFRFQRHTWRRARIRCALAMAQVLLFLPDGKGLRVFGLEAGGALLRERRPHLVSGGAEPDLPVRDWEARAGNLEKGTFGCGNWLLRSA